MPNIKNSNKIDQMRIPQFGRFCYFVRHTNITILNYTSYPISSYKKTYPPYPTATFTLPSSKKTATSTPPSCKVYKVFFFSYHKIYHKKPTLQVPIYHKSGCLSFPKISRQFLGYFTK